MIEFTEPTQLRKQIEELRVERNKHNKKYLYGGRNVYKDAKRKVDKLDRQIADLQQMKNEIEQKQLRFNQ